jgi:hypothetical protein
LLPNGKRLRSSSVTPGQILFDDNSDVIIPAGSKATVMVMWNPLDDGTFFSPRMVIRYKQNISGEIVEKTKDVPYKYVNQENSLVPVYPPASASATIVYELSAITKRLKRYRQVIRIQNYSVNQKNIHSYRF